MASISISGVRENYPGKTDAEAAAAIASEDESIVIIVRYKLFPDKDYSNFGLCYRAEEADNYYFNTNLHDVETIYDRRKQSLNDAVNFLERGINEPEFRSKINNFKDKKEKMEFIKNEGYEFTPKELENVAYELMRRVSFDEKQKYFWWWDDGHGHKHPWGGSYYDESYFGEEIGEESRKDVGGCPSLKGGTPNEIINYWKKSNEKACGNCWHFGYPVIGAPLCHLETTIINHVDHSNIKPKVVKPTGYCLSWVRRKSYY